MNTRKTKFLLGILFSLTLLLISGCSFSERRAIRAAVDTELNQLKSPDAGTVENYISSQNLLPDSEDSDNIADIFALFYKNFSYKIEKITVKENQATAQVQLKTLNAKSLAKDFSIASLKRHIEQDAVPIDIEFSLRDSYLLLRDLLESKEYKTKTHSADIQLIKKNDTWEMVHTPELDSILTGNFFTYATDSHLLSPKEIVDTHFNVIKNFDSEQLRIYLSLDYLLDTDNEYNNSISHAIAQQISNSFDFKIKEESIEKNEAVVRTSITSVDFHGIIRAYNKKLSKWLKKSESLAVGAEGRRQKEQELLLSCIKKNEASTTHDVDIHLLNDGVNWKIQMNEEIAQAVFGDVQNTMESISGEMQ